MKKVLFISNSVYDFREGGKASHLKKKFEGLVQGGVEPYVLGFGGPTRPLAIGLFRKKIWGARFYLSPKNILLWKIVFWKGFFLCLFKKIDVIVCQSPLLEGWVGSWLSIIFRKELIVELHGDWLDGPFLVKERPLEKLQRKIVLFLTRFSLKRADKVRGVAQYLIEKARPFCKTNRFYKFTTFTDFSLFLNEKDVSSQNYILFVGVLTKIKGVDILLEAFCNVLREFPNFKLVIAGDGPESRVLKEMARDLKIEREIEFKGQVALYQVKEIMKNCYCLVLSSLSEGLPRVALEAMALKKPVIASRVGGIPELVRDGQTGFLFEKNRPAELAEKLKALLQNKEKAQQMGQRGRQVVEQNFSVERYLSSYIEMLKN